MNDRAAVKQVTCPACGGEPDPLQCDDEAVCGYCDGTGKVGEEAARGWRPLSPEECL